MFPTVDLEYPNTLKLLIPEAESMTLILVGCGGTGSWLAPAIARYAKILMDSFDKRMTVVFMDPDRVEEKNIYRQNFCAAEIGRNKAETLAERYGLAWGLEIQAVPAKFHAMILSDCIVMGCVDNAAARKAIACAVSRSDSWWLDCGNTRNYGQVLVGGGDERENAFAIPGHCGCLPLPHVQHPELVKKERVAKEKQREASCAEMALQDSQGLSINQRMAAEAADYLMRMLITKDLRKFATYIDLESGTTRSKYITKKLSE